MEKKKKSNTSAPYLTYMQEFIESFCGRGGGNQSVESSVSHFWTFPALTSEISFGGIPAN